jgi:hypothetical protein
MVLQSRFLREFRFDYSIPNIKGKVKEKSENQAKKQVGIAFSATKKGKAMLCPFGV